MAEKKENKELANKEENLPATIDFGADAGAGFEDADKDSFAIPFLVILQSGSPQCKRSEGAYIKGAEEGMLYNTVTNEVFSGDDGLEILPCYYQRQFLEWAPRSKGGGLADVHNVAEAEELQQTLKTITVVEDGEEKQVQVLPNGNNLSDTRQHYVLFKHPKTGDWQPVVLGMASSQIKVSRKWMTKMQQIKIGGKEAPMFSQIYKLTTVPEKNDKGSWMGFHIEHQNQIADANLYQEARSFRDLCRIGDVKVDAGKGETTSGDPEEM